MNARVVAFVNFKGGQGKTTLGAHLAWMLADLGARVVAVDLDHQCAMTEYLVGTDEMLSLATQGRTIRESLRRFINEPSDPGEAPLRSISERFALIPGDISLLEAEDRVLVGEQAFGALGKIFEDAGTRFAADLVIVDLPSSFGAIARSTLAASDAFIVPIVPDVVGVKTLQFLGGAIDRLREDWRAQRTALSVARPDDAPRPLGYIVNKFPAYGDAGAATAQRWMNQIPAAYGSWIAKSPDAGPHKPSEDEHCLGIIALPRVLIELATETHKPVFHLTPADGAVGSVMSAALRARAHFEALARNVASKLGVALDA